MFKWLLGFSFLASSVQAQKNYSALVNPFIGTGGHGHTYPGATVPFGMVQLSPDTRMADWDGSSGYHYSDSLIYGFSHTHLSGTGVPDYCDILVQPTTGAINFNKENYASSFSHTTEKAHAGYYEVFLDKYKINVALTAAERMGIHKYTYPSNANEGNIIIDLTHRDVVLDSEIEIIDSVTIKGYRYSSAWAKNQKIFFVAKFSLPIKKYEFDSVVNIKTMHSGNYVKLALQFDVRQNKTLVVEVALSPVSTMGAMKNFKAATKQFNFNAYKKSATAVWNKELGKIEIESFKENNIDTMFYTALYHCLIVPNIFQDVDSNYRAANDSIYKAKNFTNCTVFSLWDTYRAYHPLMSIINKKRTADWLSTFLHHHKYGGQLPVWELAANETYCMIGYHSAPVILDAYNKGIKLPLNELLQALVKYSNSNKFSIDKYTQNGFLSNDIEAESVSKTLEYAFDDYCIAQLAKAAKQDSLYKVYKKRSLSYKNLYNTNTGFFQGKLQNIWYTPFDPNEINNFYTEANAWQYAFSVQHSVEDMIQLHGGKNEFTKKLQQLFTTNSKTTGRDQADVTGLIGQYAHGNEPSHHMAYLFRYSSTPELAASYINKIQNDFYTNAPDGLIGNEDCGQMSAWYIWSALGFYPVNPVSNNMVLGSPLVKKATIHLEDGNTIQLQVSKQNKSSVQPCNLIVNGKKSKEAIVDITKAKNIKIDLNDQPSTLAITTNTAKSSSEFVYAPFVANKHFVFKDSIKVVLANIDNQQKIFYSVVNNLNKAENKFTLYTEPFILKETNTIQFYAAKNNKRSATLAQQFFKTNDKDYTIQTQDFIQTILPKTYYLKIVAYNYGTIPNWHDGRNNPSHLFITEVAIK
jgi:predicted alpha-1,2-mannosidase